MSVQDILDRFLAIAEQGEPGVFAGVGSRETPEDIGLVMCAIGRKLTDAGWVLSSGGAEGADMAFESGVRVGEKGKRVLLPYSGFNGNKSTLTNIKPEAFEIAERVHPAWHNCKDFARKAHARNAHQVLGLSLNDPVQMTICWTKDGAVDAASAHNAGGTRTAIVISAEHGVPVFNLRNDEVLWAFKRWVSEDLLAEVKGDLRMRLEKKPLASLPPRTESPDEKPKPKGFRRFRAS